MTPKKKNKINTAKKIPAKKVFKKKSVKSSKNLNKKKVFKKKSVKKIVLKVKKISKKVLNKKNIVVKPQKIVKKIGKKVVKKIVKPKIKKATQKMPTQEFPAESLFKAKIKVIGIGGGGGSIVSEIGKSLEKATFVVADTDIRALKKKSGIKYFWFGEELTHGLGTGVNVELAKEAAESAKDKISGFFRDQDIVIFVASLGGGLGSGATQVFADAAKEFGGITFGIFTMPFKFEGKNKYRIAQNALKSLKNSLNVSLVIPNEKIFKVIDESTPITNAFSTVNKSLIESLESLIDLIYNPGIINIDFADLRTILKGRGNLAFLNTIEESGKDKVEKICENIFKNPLLQSNSLKAEKILFNIVGSEGLSMFDVEKISSHIATQNPKAKIIFGISKDTRLKNKIKTTILMTGGEIDEKVEEEKIVPIKLEKPELSGKIVKKEENIKIEKKIGLKEKTVKKDNIKKSNSLREKKIKPKKPIDKKVNKDRELPVEDIKKEHLPVSLIPTMEIPIPSIPVLDQKRLNVVETVPNIKKTIRRSALEIKEAEDLQEKKRIAQEKEWEIPAFLRKVKYKS